MAISQPRSASNRSGNSANPARACALRCELQQASTAFSSAEAGSLCLQRISSDQSAVSSSTQHDNDVGSGGMLPFSSCGGDDGLIQHMDRDMEAGCAQEPADVPYTGATFHYSRHQGTHHRPAVRWQTDTEMHESAQLRHSPQHLVLSPNKSCMKQRPDGYTLWLSDAQSEQSIKPWGRCLKSIDGGIQGSQVLHGRKRSRLRSID